MLETQIWGCATICFNFCRLQILTEWEINVALDIGYGIHFQAILVIGPAFWPNNETPVKSQLI